MYDIIKACNPLYASIIKKTDVDFFNKTIRFDLLSMENNNESKHILEIKNYSSFLWLEKDKMTPKEYDFKECDYYELTAITFTNIHASSNDKWLKHYLLEYNIAIEIWDSALLIKSDTVIVDGKVFRI